MVGPHKLPFMKCSVDGCDTLTNRRYKKIFYCKLHLNRLSRYGNPEPERFKNPHISGTFTCFGCGKEKDISEFKESKRLKFGIQKRCISCERERNEKKRKIYIDKKCAVYGCERKVIQKSKIDNNYYCETHLSRLKKYGYESLSIPITKGRIPSFIHPNYKENSVNPETAFCKKCGEEKHLSKFAFYNSKKNKRFKICRVCVNDKLKENRIIKNGVIEKYEIKNDKDKSLCIVKGCADKHQEKNRFCTKHRYFYDRFGCEIPPEILKCNLCNIEQSLSNFFLNSNLHRLSDCCKSCRDNIKKESKRKKRKRRIEKIKKCPDKYKIYKLKRNKMQYNRLKRNPQAMEEKRKSHRTYCANRRTRLSGNGGTHSKNDISFLFNSQKGKCVCCKSKLKKYHIDHIIPVALGGGSEKTNLQLLCPTCNRSKSMKHPVEFMQEIGFLI